MNNDDDSSKSWLWRDKETVEEIQAMAGKRRAFQKTFSQLSNPNSSLSLERRDLGALTLRHGRALANIENSKGSLLDCESNDGARIEKYSSEIEKELDKLAKTQQVIAAALSEPGQDLDYSVQSFLHEDMGAMEANTDYESKFLGDLITSYALASRAVRESLLLKLAPTATGGGSGRSGKVKHKRSTKARQSLEPVSRTGQNPLSRLARLEEIVVKSTYAPSDEANICLEDFRRLTGNIPHAELIEATLAQLDPDAAKSALQISDVPMSLYPELWEGRLDALTLHRPGFEPKIPAADEAELQDRLAHLEQLGRRTKEGLMQMPNYKIEEFQSTLTEDVLKRYRNIFDPVAKATAWWLKRYAESLDQGSFGLVDTDEAMDQPQGVFDFMDKVVALGGSDGRRLHEILGDLNLFENSVVSDQKAMELRRQRTIHAREWIERAKTADESWSKLIGIRKSINMHFYKPVERLSNAIPGHTTSGPLERLDDLFGYDTLRFRHALDSQDLMQADDPDDNDLPLFRHVKEQSRRMADLSASSPFLSPFSNVSTPSEIRLEAFKRYGNTRSMTSGNPVDWSLPQNNLSLKGNSGLLSAFESKYRQIAELQRDCRADIENHRQSRMSRLQAIDMLEMRQLADKFGHEFCQPLNTRLLEQENKFMSTMLEPGDEAALNALKTLHARLKMDFHDVQRTRLEIDQDLNLTRDTKQLASQVSRHVSAVTWMTDLGKQFKKSSYRGISTLEDFEKRRDQLKTLSEDRQAKSVQTTKRPKGGHRGRRGSPLPTSEVHSSLSERKGSTSDHRAVNGDDGDNGVATEQTSYSTEAPVEEGWKSWKELLDELWESPLDGGDWAEEALTLCSGDESYSDSDEERPHRAL